MKGRTFYDPETGAGIYTSSQDVDKYPHWIEGYHNMKTCWFPGGVVTDRTQMTPVIVGADPAAVGVPVAFTGFPDDAIVTIDGSEYQLDDGTINFTAETVGDYVIEATHRAHIRYRVIIDVY